MEKYDNSKRLGLMRYWLVGTFIIVFVAITVYLGMFVNWSNALLTGLPVWAITGVLCVVAYYGYKWYLNRKK